MNKITKKELENKDIKELGVMLSAGYKGKEHNLITEVYMKKRAEYKKKITDDLKKIAENRNEKKP